MRRSPPSFRRQNTRSVSCSASPARFRRLTPRSSKAAGTAHGSPATSYGLWAGSRIVEVDGHPVRDLDEFIAAVSEKIDRDSVRLTAVQWNGAPEVTTLKLDNKYWPAYELRHTADGWQRIALSGSTSALAGMPEPPPAPATTTSRQ